MSKELYDEEPTLGIPKPVAVPLIILTSVSIVALVAVLIILRRQE